ncbi:MAG: type II toxin-antitoxin system VapC family toxin [Alphaproteobacteria bacterium]|nr:type II toxin-antitoxin system VapC family toxin [Alphaproteobacteria bacterium]
MRLLLDTHLLIWWLNDDAALSVTARQAIADPGSEVFVSAASVWEIAIKHALGKLAFPIGRMSGILGEAGFAPMSIEIQHTIRAGALPRHHDDPFDRMLIAQAQLEGLVIATADSMFKKYDVSLIDGAD